MYKLYIFTQQLGVGRVLPQCIFGEALYIHILQLGWDRLSHLQFFATGPPRASSPPGAHVRGESSQLSMAYRYLSPKIKE